MRKSRWTLCTVALSLLVATGLTAQRRPDRMMADELFDAYQSHGPRVVAEAIESMPSRFERFRSDLESRVLPTWRHDGDVTRHALFLLELAIATNGRRHSYVGWETLLERGSTLLAERPQAPGADASTDAFEVLWHQTAVAFLDTLQDPFLRDRVGVQPMTDRIAATRPPNGAVPVLVDPWVALARGVSLELMSLARPEGLVVFGPEALKQFDHARRFGADGTRLEATLRAARVLLRLSRPAEALQSLSEIDSSDLTYRYWLHLLRGQALDALGRPDEAASSYQAALRLVPSAETARVALLVLSVKRLRTTDVATQLSAFQRTSDAAAELASVAPTQVAPDPAAPLAPDAAAPATTADVAGGSIDPWRSYRDGDARFLQARLTALREMSRR